MVLINEIFVFELHFLEELLLEEFSISWSVGENLQFLLIESLLFKFLYHESIHLVGVIVTLLTAYIFISQIVSVIELSINVKDPGSSESKPRLEINDVLLLLTNVIILV